MTYIIQHTRDPAYTIDTALFAEQLRSKWPAVEVRIITDPRSLTSIEYRIPMQYDLLVFLSDDRRMLLLEGDDEDSASFALWYRDVVPYNYRMIYYCGEAADEGFDVELTKDTTLEDIINAF